MVEPACELDFAPHEGAGWRLSTQPPGHVVLAIGFADLAPPDPGAPFALREAGPRRWLYVGEADRPATTPGAQFALVDLSHARERLELSGPGADRALAAGTALDLRNLAIGASRNTLFGSIAVHLTRTGAQSYELLVGRTFARALWRQLTHG